MKFGFVSLVGRPNAGKSTLLNYLVGEKIAIVSDKPQTTRHRILGVKHTPGGQIVFLDTPGIHRPLHRMNVRMMDAVLESMRQVDVLGLVVDATAPSGSGDRFTLSLVARFRRPTILLLNKIDLIAKPKLLPIIAWYSGRCEFAEIIPVSALTGDGLDRLEATILQRLPEGEALYPPDYLTDQPERALAAEMVREQVLQQTSAELPFTTVVVVDRFEEPNEQGLLRIFASILVEQESQKRIVVGRGGDRIKQIGTAARLELERLFGTHVFLDLHVKVRLRWRDDDRLLDRLGVGGTGIS